MEGLVQGAVIGTTQGVQSESYGTGPVTMVYVAFQNMSRITGEIKGGPLLHLSTTTRYYDQSASAALTPPVQSSIRVTSKTGSGARPVLYLGACEGAGGFVSFGLSCLQQFGEFPAVGLACGFTIPRLIAGPPETPATVNGKPVGDLTTVVTQGDNFPWLAGFRVWKSGTGVIIGIAGLYNKLRGPPQVCVAPAVLNRLGECYCPPAPAGWEYAPNSCTLVEKRQFNYEVYSAGKYTPDMLSRLKTYTVDGQPKIVRVGRRVMTTNKPGGGTVDVTYVNFLEIVGPTSTIKFGTAVTSSEHAEYLEPKSFALEQGEPEYGNWHDGSAYLAPRIVTNVRGQPTPIKSTLPYIWQIEVVADWMKIYSFKVIYHDGNRCPLGQYPSGGVCLPACSPDDTANCICLDPITAPDAAAVWDRARCGWASQLGPAASPQVVGLSTGSITSQEIKYAGDVVSVPLDTVATGSIQISKPQVPSSDPATSVFADRPELVTGGAPTGVPTVVPIAVPNVSMVPTGVPTVVPAVVPAVESSAIGTDFSLLFFIGFILLVLIAGFIAWRRAQGGVTENAELTV